MLRGFEEVAVLYCDFWCACFFARVMLIFLSVFILDLWAKIHKIRDLWEKN